MIAKDNLATDDGEHQNINMAKENMIFC